MGAISGLGQGLGSIAKTLGATTGTTANRVVKSALLAGPTDKFEGNAANLAPAPAPSYEERYAQALNMLDTYFDVLDTAAGKGKKDGKISEKDLKAALKNSDFPEELREACRFLLKNKSVFQNLKNGWWCSTINKKNVANALSKLPEALRRPSVIDSAYQAKWANAVTQLNLYFDLLDTAAGKGKRDGKIGHSDLKAAAKNPELPQELRDACRFLTNNPAAYNQLDASANGKRDGLISKKDVAAVFEKLPEELRGITPSAFNYRLTWANAVTQLNLYFDLLDTAAGKGKRDGKIGHSDLKAAAKNPGLPPELREACQFFISNPAAFNQLDASANGKRDGLISKKDLAAVFFSPARPVDALATLDFSAMQVDFDRLWNESFPGPGGVATEHGGTLVVDPSGALRIVNMGMGNSGSFSPNLNVGSNQTILGIFHTHPYDSGATGISFSGGDAAYLINMQQNFIIAQSGTEQFMYMRTDASPKRVDFRQLNNAQNARITELRKSGMSFSEASKQAARETAQAYGLAYYEGSNGIFHRVYPA